MAKASDRGFFRIGQMRLQHLPVEGLAQRIGGDEAKTPGLARPHGQGRLLPPKHHEIGAFRHLRIGRAQRLGIAVT